MGVRAAEWGSPKAPGCASAQEGSWGPPRTAVQVLHCVLRHVRQRPSSPAPYRIGVPRWGPSLMGPGFRAPSAHGPALWAPGHSPNLLPACLFSSPRSVGGWYLHPPGQCRGGIFIPLVDGR